jgi:hypothetical protein
LNEAHREAGPAAVVGSQPVDGDDARVLQPASDLGLEQEPPLAGRVVVMSLQDLLQRHLAVQLGDDKGCRLIDV